MAAPAAESVEKLGISMTVWGKRGVTVDTASMVTRSAAAGVAAGELHAGEDQGGPAVGGGADLEQPQGVGHHGGGQHLVGGDLLAVAGVGVLQRRAGRS